MLKCLNLALTLLVLFTPTVAAQESVDGFVARVFRSQHGVVMPYRMFMPQNYRRDQYYQLIVYLHGSGGAGTDNLKQISGGNTVGTRAWTKPANGEAVFVVAPQAPSTEQWASPDATRLSNYGAATVELIEQLQKELPIDANRIVLTGQSRGGFGTWDIALKEPERFAAIVPLCGGGKPSAAVRIKDVPVWAFHGLLDETVPVKESRDMVRALRAIGGNVKYTEYSDVGHAVWERAYKDPALIDWVLRQRRPPKAR